MLLPNNEFLATAAKIAAEMGIRAYLVGGGPRDMVMGRDISDFDFALEDEPEQFPRLFARTIGGTFFWLDEQRLQSRVVRTCDAGVMTFDCAPLRGAGIDEDLSLRDFTINALAIPLDAEEVPLIDPLGALRDIRQGVIRACSDACFDDDPLRLLRALRFAATSSASSVGSMVVRPPSLATRLVIASTTAGAEWPAIAPVSPSAKSMYSLPSMSQTRLPTARSK